MASTTAQRLATDALKKLHFAAFAITLQGVGSFATQDGAHALWVGVDPTPQLTALHAAIAGSLAAAIDYKPEDRPYHPHITTARLGSPVAAAVDRFVTQHANFHFAPFRVTEFALYTSSFAGDVPRYQIRIRYGPS
jgi:RNA 2',3'-cyclic 3'-phosphodiesterase